jgi:hypothetical protein
LHFPFRSRFACSSARHEAAKGNYAAALEYFNISMKLAEQAAAIERIVKEAEPSPGEPFTALVAKWRSDARNLRLNAISDEESAHVTGDGQYQYDAQMADNRADVLEKCAGELENLISSPPSATQG